MGEKHVNTRELLRNFRKYKEMLRTGSLHVIYIKVDDGEELELYAHGKKGNGAAIVEKIRALKRPIRIVRDPALFDGLLRTLPRK